MADEAGQEVDVVIDVEAATAAPIERVAGETRRVRAGRAAGRGDGAAALGAEAPAPDFATAIYQAITRVFASTNPMQLFCLCWPGTVLEYEHLRWSRDEEVGGNMPEHAFLRSSQILDQYVPPAPLTQPDGTRVSTRYQQAISQLGPIPNAGLLRLQRIVRERLQDEIVRDVEGVERTFTLVEWFGYLYGRWADASRRWGEKQLELQQQLRQRYESDPDSNAWWDAYLEWYGDNATGWIARVNERWQQLVAEFPLTEWEDAMAILETKDDEGLDEARTVMRNAIRPVPYQEGIQYVPTTGVPYEWPLELKPVTKYLDLLADPQAQQMAYETAIAQLEQEIFNWAAILPQVEEDALRSAYRALDEAQRAYGSAQAELLRTYTRNAVEAVRAVCEIMRSNEQTVEGIVEEREPERRENEDAIVRKVAGMVTDGTDVNWELVERIAERIGRGQESLIERQEALLDTGFALARAAEAFLADKAHQSSFPWLAAYVAQLRSKLEAVRRAAADHASAANVWDKYASSVREGGEAKRAGEFAADAYPSPLDVPADDRWTVVTATIDARQLEAATRMTTSFSASQWGVDLFLGSGGGRSQSESSNFASRFMQAGSSIQIGFLATKVLIERPWMRAELFGATHSFFRTSETPIALGEPVTAEALLEARGGSELNERVLNGSTFPAYPAALLLVKDVTVRVQIEATRTEDVREYAKSTKSEGGGFLCFSISKTSTSTSQSESTNEFCMAGQMVARAPAPQIVGYWVQLQPPDRSTVLSDEEATLISQSLGFLEKLQNVHQSGETVAEPVRRI